MNIILNGKKTEVGEGISLLRLLKEKDIDADKVVVEHNYEILKKDDLASIILKENDNIEVLKFVGGG